MIDPQNKVVRFLVFCAGSSHDILDKCPTSEWNKHISIGGTVLFTGILAMLSSFYAFQVVFHAFYISLPLSLFWALIIFNLDRYIVSSFRKNGRPLKEFLQAAPRILLAVAIAMVISKPLELEIFKTEIRQALSETRKRSLQALEERHEAAMRQLALQTRGLKDELSKYFDLKEAYYKDYICECDGTCGTGTAGRGTECTEKQRKYEQFVGEFNTEKARIDAALAAVERQRTEAVEGLRSDKERLEADFSQGLLARLNALGGIGGLASFSITLLLILIEITPVFSKLMAPEGPYDNLLRMGENEFRLKYMRTVYQQNVEMHSISLSPALQAGAGDGGRRQATETEEKYAALRKELQKKLKDR